MKSCLIKNSNIIIKADKFLSKNNWQRPVFVLKIFDYYKLVYAINLK